MVHWQSFSPPGAGRVAVLFCSNMCGCLLISYVFVYRTEVRGALSQLGTVGGYRQSEPQLGGGSASRHWSAHTGVPRHISVLCFSRCTRTISFGVDPSYDMYSPSLASSTAWPTWLPFRPPYVRRAYFCQSICRKQPCWTQLIFNFVPTDTRADCLRELCVHGNATFSLCC
jgi:hypothetical protein